MSLTLADLEAARTKLLQQFLSLGDFRPGTVSAIPRRCGKPKCHCAHRNGEGHPQFRLLRKVKGKSVSESFATPAAFRKAAQELADFFNAGVFHAGPRSVADPARRANPLGGLSAKSKRSLLVDWDDSNGARYRDTTAPSWGNLRRLRLPERNLVRRPLSLRAPGFGGRCRLFFCRFLIRGLGQ